MVDMPCSTYSNYENNKRVPSEYNLKKIAKCLEIDMSDLVNWGAYKQYSKIKTLADYTLEELLNEVLRRLN
jgi:transcriptional regulator with XRE-family HTH domain